jgi:hypothetical protein
VRLEEQYIPPVTAAAHPIEAQDSDPVTPVAPGGNGSPAERVSDAVTRWGESDVVRRCASLLRLGPDDDVVGDGLELAMVLGGRGDAGWFAGGKPPGHRYWARAWAARALLYVWGDSATEPVVGALGDEQWRVRELAAKVVRLRELAVAVDRLVDLIDDDVPRVRVAVARALAVVGEGEHGDVLATLIDDPDRAVAGAATDALAELSRRLDRRF